MLSSAPAGVVRHFVYNTLKNQIIKETHATADSQGREVVEMDPKTDKTFAAKHPSGSEIDPHIQAAIDQKTSAGNLPCAVAFDIADRLSATPEDVGKALDLMNIRLSKCQLGLFGYEPDKKIVKPSGTIAPQLETAIRNALVGNHLACIQAWEIASQLGLRKMAVSSACEALSIKIKPCQLGAF